MKTAKLFIDGQEYCDVHYLYDSDIKNAIDYALNNMDLTEFGQGAEIEFSVEDLDGNLTHEGVGYVEWNPSISLSFKERKQ